MVVCLVQVSVYTFYTLHLHLIHYIDCIIQTKMYITHSISVGWLLKLFICFFLKNVIILGQLKHFKIFFQAVIPIQSVACSDNIALTEYLKHFQQVFSLLKLIYFQCQALFDVIYFQCQALLDVIFFQCQALLDVIISVFYFQCRVLLDVIKPQKHLRLLLTLEVSFFTNSFMEDNFNLSRLIDASF